MATFTAVHVGLSLIGILTGIIALIGFLTRSRLTTWNAVFLATTALTSLTGYGFPFERLLPSHIVGALSLVVLAIAAFARYGRQLAGGWNRTYVVTATFALYFNVFVLVVQSFMKVPALHDLAPTQSEPPFAVAQLIVLLIFVVAGASAFVRARQPVAR